MKSINFFKFAHNYIVTRLISNHDETDYTHEIDRIIDWCETNNLFLNVNKLE